MSVMYAQLLIDSWYLSGCGSYLRLYQRMNITYKLGLLTKREVKMARIGQFFFFHIYGRDGVEVYKWAKRERGQYSFILTEQAWSIAIKDYVMASSDQIMRVPSIFISWPSTPVSC